MSGREKCSHMLTQWLGKVLSLPFHHGWTATSQLQYPGKSRKGKASVRDYGPIRMMLSKAATATQPSPENRKLRGNLDSNKIHATNVLERKTKWVEGRKTVEEKNQKKPINKNSICWCPEHASYQIWRNDCYQLVNLPHKYPVHTSDGLHSGLLQYELQKMPNRHWGNAILNHSGPNKLHHIGALPFSGWVTHGSRPLFHCRGQQPTFGAAAGLTLVLRPLGNPEHLLCFIIQLAAATQGWLFTLKVYLFHLN